MYSFQSRVRFSELNHKQGTLSCSSMINYFQDCSTFQSEDLNLGLSYLRSKNKVWLLNSWQLNLLEPVKLGDSITIGTWPYDFKGFYGFRNFIMKDSEDRPLATANSIWVYLDTQTGRPTKVPDDTGYELEPPYPMEYAKRKIEIPKDFTPYPPFPVKKYNIDTYNHVNNGQYIRMAEEFLPDRFYVQQLRAEYKTQAVLGDSIVPLISEEENCIKIVLSSVDNNSYAVIEFQGVRN